MHTFTINEEQNYQLAFKVDLLNQYCNKKKQKKTCLPKNHLNWTKEKKKRKKCKPRDSGCVQLFFRCFSGSRVLFFPGSWSWTQSFLPSVLSASSPRIQPWKTHQGKVKPAHTFHTYFMNYFVMVSNSLSGWKFLASAVLQPAEYISFKLLFQCFLLKYLCCWC